MVCVNKNKILFRFDMRCTVCALKIHTIYKSREYDSYRIYLSVCLVGNKTNFINLSSLDDAFKLSIVFRLGSYNVALIQFCYSLGLHLNRIDVWHTCFRANYLLG